MKWRMIGPFRAGKVNGVAGVPGNPAIDYLGADGGGVGKTTDGGVTCEPIFDGGSAASIGAIAVTALMALRDGADFAPSEESFAALHRVCQGWKEELAALQEFKNKDVEALNRVAWKESPCAGVRHARSRG